MGALGDDGSAGLPEGVLFDDTQDYAMWAFTARRERYGFRRVPEGMDGSALRDAVLGMTEG